MTGEGRNKDADLTITAFASAPGGEGGPYTSTVTRSTSVVGQWDW